MTKKIKKPLRILLVEDSEEDAALILEELQRSGYDLTYERVQTEETMDTAMQRQEWDVVLADYAGPNFSASSDSGIATVATNTVETQPAKNEPSAEIDNAAPARPCRAI